MSDDTLRIFWAILSDRQVAQIWELLDDKQLLFLQAKGAMDRRTMASFAAELVKRNLLGTGEGAPPFLI